MGEISKALLLLVNTLTSVTFYPSNGLKYESYHDGELHYGYDKKNENQPFGSTYFYFLIDNK